MLSGDLAREQIQDRVRAAAQDRRATTVRQVRTQRGGSGLLAAITSLRLQPRSKEVAPVRVAGTAL